MTQVKRMKIKHIGLRKTLDVPVHAVSNRFGDRSKGVERFIKFAMVGALGAVIDFGTVFFLQATILPPVEPNATLKVFFVSTVAFFLAVTSNFLWNRYWTYPDSRSRSAKKQMVQFTVINVIGWAARSIWVSSSFEFLGTTFMPIFLPLIRIIRPLYEPSHSAEAKLGSMLALLTGVVVVMIWNFLANRYWTFGDID